MVGIWRLTVGRGGPTSIRLGFVLEQEGRRHHRNSRVGAEAGQTKIAGSSVRKLGVQSEGRVMRRFRDSSTPLGMTINQIDR